MGKAHIFSAQQTKAEKRGLDPRGVTHLLGRVVTKLALLTSAEIREKNLKEVWAETQ